jgi:hypothetical protein
MKKSDIIIISVSAVAVILFIAISVLLMRPGSVSGSEPQKIIVQGPERIITQPARTPEYRGPPLREYKPSTFQQVGLLMGGSETFPIYGKPSYAYRDRWNYYTTTQGEQMYPLPISNGDRDCTEDIGCQELYGNEDLSILGKEGTFKSKIYRVIS